MESIETIDQDILNLIRIHARQIIKNMPNEFDVKDLEQAGFVGYLDALRRYHLTFKVDLLTYAEYRIKGEIFDQIRTGSGYKRTLIQQRQIVSNAERHLIDKLNRHPYDYEVAEFLKISLEKLMKWKKNINSLLRISLDSSYKNHDDSRKDFLLIRNICENKENQPENLYEEKEMKEILAKTIDDFTHKAKIVLSLYYIEGLHMKEIAKVLEVTESRVSQIHKKAIQRLRETLANAIGLEAIGRTVNTIY